MNVKTIKIFGREITFQDEELLMPKYSQIRGILKEPSWCHKNIYKMILSLIIPMILVTIGIAIWIGLRKNCKSGYSGNNCENYDACWNNPCEGCLADQNGLNYTYICCGHKYLGSKCQFSDLKRSASYALIALRNGSMVAGYENSTIIIWKDNTLTTNTKLNAHKKKVKSLALFGDDLLASGSCDSTIKIWNLKTASDIKTLKEPNGCVNALISFDFLNRTYLISSSGESIINVWDSSFKSIVKLEYYDAITALAYDPFLKFVAFGSKDNQINLYSVSFKLLDTNDSAHQNITKAIYVLKSGLIATSSYDSTIKIWKQNDSKTFKLITTITEHENVVYALASLSNGSLISGSADSTLKVWYQTNDTTFECVRSLIHPFLVISLAVLKNFVISGLGNGSIYVWNETSLEFIQVLNNHTSTVWSIVELDKQSFASAAEDGKIKIWKMNKDSLFVLYASLEEHKYQVYSLNVLKDGRLISAGREKTIFVWHKDTFKLEKVLMGHQNTICGLTVFENGNFVSVSVDQMIVMWDSNSLTSLESFDTKEEIYSVALFSNDSFITGTYTGSISIWDTKSIDLLHFQVLKQTHSDSILALAFIRPKENSFLLLSSSNDKSIKVWDLEILKCIKTLTGLSSSVLSLIPINQKSFASGSADKSIKIWEYYSDVFESSFKNVETIKESSESILALAVLNETKLISSSIDRYIRVFNKSIEIKQINELKGHSKSVQDIAVLDENLFASCSGDKTILIWNNSIQTFNLTDHTDYVYALEYSCENHLLISGSKDTTIRLWNTSLSFSLIITMYFHEDSVNSLLVLSNQTLISGSCDNKIAVWKLTSFKLDIALEGHNGCVNTLAIYDSNKYLLSGSTDTTIIIWNILNEYKLEEVLRGHQNSVNSVVIYQENIVSASSDKSIKIWSKYELSLDKHLSHDSAIMAICILNKDIIVTGSFDYKIKVWRKKNQNLELITTLKDHSNNIYDLKCLKNNSFISSSMDKTVKIWQQSIDNTFKCVKTMDHKLEVTSLTVLNGLLISGESAGKINIWNSSSYVFLASFSGHNDAILSLVSLNSQRFASSSADKNIKIWEQTNNSFSFRCVFILTNVSKSPVKVLAVLKEIYLISGCFDGLIKIWSFIDFSLLKILTEHSLAITGLTVFENDNFISVSLDRKIIIWDFESLSEIETLYDDNEVWSVSGISHDSFVTGNKKGSLKIWSYYNFLRPIKTLKFQDEVFALKVLNNGLLASASQNGNIKIWDNTFQPKEIKAHSKAVLALNEFLNGTFISCSEDRTIKTWNPQQYILEKKIK